VTLSKITYFGYVLCKKGVRDISRAYFHLHVLLYDSSISIICTNRVYFPMSASVTEERCGDKILEDQRQHRQTGRGEQVELNNQRLKPST
jgi:hypothetical protein